MFFSFFGITLKPAVFVAMPREKPNILAGG